MQNLAPEKIAFIRQSIYWFSLTSFLLLETVFPFFARKGKRERLISHGALAVMNGCIDRIVGAGVTLFLIQFTETNGIGLLNWIPFPAWTGIFASVVLFDLFGYLNHRLHHRSQLLWVLHQVHHGDNQLDVTTAARIHPFQRVTNFGVRWIGVLVLGPSLAEYSAYVAVSMFFVHFHHANLRMPVRLEKIVRRVFVTPFSHSFHHSKLWAQREANFGEIFQFWDRLFKTEMLGEVATTEFGLPNAPDRPMSVEALFPMKFYRKSVAGDRRAAPPPSARAA